VHGNDPRLRLLTVASPYWTRLAESSAEVHGDLDRVLERFDVRPVGWGYIDIIVVPSRAEQFLAELTRIGIATCIVTLWCEASEINKQRYGCPHGMGGPIRNGVWFSEMCERDPFRVEDLGVDISESQLDPFALARACNELALGFATTGIRDRPEYSPCLAPGFWLAVPEDWRSDAAAGMA